MGLRVGFSLHFPLKFCSWAELLYQVLRCCPIPVDPINFYTKYFGRYVTTAVRSSRDCVSGLYWLHVFSFFLLGGF